MDGSIPYRIAVADGESDFEIVWSNGRIFGVTAVLDVISIH